MPEWKKAATALKGIVKVAAIDADKHKDYGMKYNVGGFLSPRPLDHETALSYCCLSQKVQGFPTIKIFGVDKKKPTEYNGGRTAGEIIDAAIKVRSPSCSLHWL